jgi:hypothetical protein
MDGMTKYSVVMTLGPHNWEQYGHKSVASFDKHWPKDIHLWVYYEGQAPDFVSPRVHFLDYHTEIPEHQMFSERNGHRHEHVNDVHVNNITHQATKFAFKVYAQLEELESPRTQYVIYLDGDNVTMKDITEELLDKLVHPDVYLSFVNRMPAKYTETSIMIWDTHNENHEEWCSTYRNMYDGDKIFEYSAWHDCIAFDETTFPMIKAKKIKAIDLGFGAKSKHPLVVGPLGEYFDHLKGPSRKQLGYSKERKHAGF